MAVTVISKPLSKRKTCVSCECLLEYEVSDIEMTVHNQEFVLYRITCPNCSYKMSVDRHQIIVK